MANEKFNLTLNDCRNLGSSGKKGDSCTYVVGFTCVTGAKVSVSLHVSGPDEAMAALFNAWPIDFSSTKKTIAMKIPVEVTLSNVLSQSAGQAVNQMAADAAQAAAATPAPAPAEGLVGVKAEIDQLTK